MGTILLSFREAAAFHLREIRGLGLQVKLVLRYSQRSERKSEPTVQNQGASPLNEPRSFTHPRFIEPDGLPVIFIFVGFLAQPMKLLERVGIGMNDAGTAAVVAFHDYASDRSAALLLRERPGQLEIGSAVCVKIMDHYLAATAAHNILNLAESQIEIVPAGERRAEALHVRRIGYPGNWEDEDVACLELDPVECARARRVRFVPLQQLAPLKEQEEPRVCCLQGYPAETVEKISHADQRPLAESGGLLTLIIPPSSRRAANKQELIGIEFPPHDGSLDKSALPHPLGLSGGAVWLFPTFQDNPVWAAEKAKLIAIERGWFREHREVVATRIERWLGLVATQIPELRPTIEAAFGPLT